MKKHSSKKLRLRSIKIAHLHKVNQQQLKGGMATGQTTCSVICPTRWCPADAPAR